LKRKEGRLEKERRKTRKGKRKNEKGKMEKIRKEGGKKVGKRLKKE